MRRAGLFFGLLVTGLSLYLVFGGRPAAMDPESHSFLQLQPGLFEARWEDIELVDSSRPTQLRGEPAGSDKRVLNLRGVNCRSQFDAQRRIFQWSAHAVHDGRWYD